MGVYIISDSDGKTRYTVFADDDFEYLNPIRHFSESMINMHINLERDFCMLNKPPIPFVPSELVKNAIEKWREHNENIKKTELSSNWIALLNSNSKSEQVKLLKGASLTPDGLTALIIKAWTDFNYSFSQYSAEHLHNGLIKSEMPKVLHVSGDDVSTMGSTSLSDGQLRQAVEHRKVTVSKFLDKGSTWHCLFLTFRSLRGEENWKDGQPHLHYISDKFGISRQNVVKELKSKDYNLGNLPHIDLLDYGVQPNNPNQNN